MVPLLRAVVAWTIVLASVILPRLGSPSVAPTAEVTQLSSFDRTSALSESKAKRTQAAQDVQVQQWSSELAQGLAQYQAEQEKLAQAQAVAAAEAAANNHPPPPAWIGKIINDAFSPLGQAAVTWALRIAWCESRYHPNSVNSDSGASGLFQFMPSTWSGTPWASQSPFDPVANANAAAWLYSHYGPGRWSCK
ncbi:MAG: lytic transglycosylase domain-containing protein [Chloroflexi bacterium]|nr:MAG: lytic transglycosylase domain-containing protein [Chloroflexota bacterium]